MKKALLFTLLSLLFCNCTKQSGTEKHHRTRDNILLVNDKVHDLEINDVFIGQISRLYIVGEYLVISDLTSMEDIVHIFDKNDFSYFTSAIKKGRGPGEITNLGEIVADYRTESFYATDYGKQSVFIYPIDSLLINSMYVPEVKVKTSENLHPHSYVLLNDSLALGDFYISMGVSDYKPGVGKWNMNTGKVELMPYDHPDIRKKRSVFCASVPNNIYVEAYKHHDLMTICNLDGELLYNIYGRAWDTKESNRMLYYRKVIIADDKIVALYSGDQRLTEDMKQVFPTKLLVFNIEGDYIKTVETKYPITDMCYDQDNNRIIMALENEAQFAHLNLEGII